VRHPPPKKGWPWAALPRPCARLENVSPVGGNSGEKGRCRPGGHRLSGGGRATNTRFHVGRILQGSARADLRNGWMRSFASLRSGDLDPRFVTKRQHRRGDARHGSSPAGRCIWWCRKERRGDGRPSSHRAGRRATDRREHPASGSGEPWPGSDSPDTATSRCGATRQPAPCHGRTPSTRFSRAKSASGGDDRPRPGLAPPRRPGAISRRFGPPESPMDRRRRAVKKDRDGDVHRAARGRQAGQLHGPGPSCR